MTPDEGGKVSLRKRIEKLERELKRLKHTERMGDPKYREFFAKYGDPETVGRTIARTVMAEYKRKYSGGN